MRKTGLIYKLRRRAIDMDELAPYLFLLTPIFTVMLVLFLWFVLNTD